MCRQKPADSIRLTANTLLTGAIEFADLADLHASNRLPIEQDLLLLTFVLGRALELALKAVLRHDNRSEQELRGYGHNVQRLYEAVLQEHAPKRLKLTLRRQVVLRSLRVYYTGKFLEYPQIGTYQLPPPYVLRGLVREAIRFGIDHVRGPGTFRRHDANLPRGVRIAAGAHYRNASRRRTLRDQIRRFERFMLAAEA
jgi:hypothetical protein